MINIQQTLTPLELLEQKCPTLTTLGQNAKQADIEALTGVVAYKTMGDGQILVYARFEFDVWELPPSEFPNNTKESARKLNFKPIKNPTLKALAKWVVWSKSQKGAKGNSLKKDLLLVRSLITWVESEPLRAKRDFDACLAHKYVAYVNSLTTMRKGVEKPLRPEYKASKLVAVEDIHTYGQMFNWVKEPPWVDSSAYEQAGVAGDTKKSSRQAGKTPIIPEDVLSTLATFTKGYLDRAAELLDLRDKLAAYKTTAKDTSNKSSQKRRYLQTLSSDFNKLDDVNEALLLLRDSCIFWLLLTTGMRIHEILNIKRSRSGKNGINHRIETKDEETFYYIQSVSDKTYEGKTEWIAPKIAIDAIAILEQYSKPFQEQLDADLEAARNQGNHREVSRLNTINNHLILSQSNSIRINILPAVTVTQKRLKNLCRACGVQWDLAAHQFRRTFANYVVHSEMGDIRALREHFKHWSITMTALYAANDDLDQELFEEILREKYWVEEEIQSDWFGLDTPIAGGIIADNIKEFRSNEDNIRVFGSHREMVRAMKLPIRSTGIGWCTNDDDGCMGGRCDECDHGIVDRRNVQHWQGMLIQQLELVDMDDIGDAGKASVQEGLVRTEKVLTALGYDVESMKQELSNNNQVA